MKTKNYCKNSLGVLFGLISTLLLGTTINAQAVIRVLTVDTDLDEITLGNLGDFSQDIATYWLCLGPGSYVQISNAATGPTDLQPGETVVVSYDLDPLADGFSLFTTNSFSSNDPAILIDYVQWGAANQPRVNQAVAAGRWDDADNFITGSSPYSFSGGANDFGSQFWESTLNTDEQLRTDLTIYPSPASDYLNVILKDEIGQNLILEIYDLNGQAVFSTSTMGELMTVIDLSDLRTGIYLLTISNDSHVLTSEKVVLQR